MNTIPQNLRMQDLIAKTARVTLLDTIRVILALDAVNTTYGREPLPILDFVGPLIPSRPSPENVAACERAAFEMREGDLERRDDVDTVLQNLDRLL